MWVYNISKLLLLLLGTTLHYTEGGHHHHDNEGQANVEQEPESSEEDMPKGLSPWELHVVNDLLVEVMLLKCQNVNRTVARGLKTFITSQVSKGPRVETMNSHFFPVYTNLVKCMDDIDAQRDKKVGPDEKPKDIADEKAVTDLSDFSTFAISTESSESIELEQTTDDSASAEENSSSGPIVIEEEESEEAIQFHTAPKPHVIEHPNDLVHQQILVIGLAFNDKDKNEGKKDDAEYYDDNEIVPEIEPEVAQENTKKVPKSSKSILASASDLVSKIWGRTTSWFSSLGRKKRAVENEDVVYHKKRHNKKYKGSLQYIATKQIMHKYKEIFQTLERLAQRSCSAKHRPNHEFTSKAIKEIIYWVGKDFPAALNAYEKYFIQGYMGVQVQQCLLNESF